VVASALGLDEKLGLRFLWVYNSGEKIKCVKTVVTVNMEQNYEHDLDSVSN
jgi:hypothetical protein